MKTVKFYYSKPVHVRLVPVMTDSQGEVNFVFDSVSQIVRTLPRVTVASIYDPIDNTMSFGVSVCSPKDIFKKSVGRKLAEDRARIKPNVKVKLTGRKRDYIRRISKKYSNDLISEYLSKDVHFDL